MRVRVIPSLAVLPFAADHAYKIAVQTDTGRCRVVRRVFAAFALVDVFAQGIYRGNPAGVVQLRALEQCSTASMQATAAEINAPATAFIAPVAVGDAATAESVTSRCNRHAYDVRWFSSSAELPLCGHATMGAAKALISSGAVPMSLPTADEPGGGCEISFHSRAAGGYLTVTCRRGVAESRGRGGGATGDDDDDGDDDDNVPLELSLESLPPTALDAVRGFSSWRALCALPLSDWDPLCVYLSVTCVRRRETAERINAVGSVRDAPAGRAAFAFGAVCCARRGRPGCAVRRAQPLRSADRGVGCRHRFDSFAACDTVIPRVMPPPMLR